MPLLSVLWGIALLAVIATTAMDATGTSRKLADNGLYAAEADAIAEAAIVRAAIGLSDPTPGTGWRADGRPRQFELRRWRAVVRIQDELGRIDLNFADQDLLFGLLRSAGIEPQKATVLALAILEWRMTPVPGVSASGQPQRRLFQSVNEVLLVPGMSPDLFARIEPALTVYSQRPTFDPQLAPAEALLALPGASRDQVAQTLAHRAQVALRADAAPSLKGRAYSLAIEATDGSHKRVYRATIRFTDDPAKPYWLLDFQVASRS
ncbi:general secretion pathway protein GspK [Bradyrhizobium sp. Y36]|uniref:type II secretion system protein GspK n=1 Tax=Bradyrhizobium sp. Y36 TaxID=2035447 RepID=UPI000BE7A5D2|nr:type II secretion system protein GspK [Bradyrhizobium sp. Y36]PDT87484.1 general secretion pathway protein GspK [Bradyrhizobium sp. Y36]